MAVILQILPRLESGGVERGVIEIVKAITNAKFKAIVVSEGGSLEPFVRKYGGTHIKLSVATKNPFKIYWNHFRLKKIIKKYEVDIVHARSRAPAWSAYLACRKTNTKFITTFHGVYSGSSKLKKFYNKIMLKGEKIISVSKFISDHIKDNYGFSDKNKIQIIHRGADVNYFDKKHVNPNKVLEYYANWHLPEDKKIILMPGRITEWKGQETLIEALAWLGRDDYYCMILGNDSGHANFRKKLEELIRQRGLIEQVGFFPNSNDMINIYNLSNMVISASTRPEAFGRTVVEAGAMEKIVIASNHGGASETIIDGKTGFHFEPGNAKDLSDKINFVLNMKVTNKKKMGVEARKYIVENFSTEKMQDKTIKLYKKCLKT